MQRITILWAAAALCLFAVLAYAQNATELKQGPGRDQVTGYCSQCHSLDYIQGNSPFMTRQVWEAEVQKMIKVYGAPIPVEEVPKIVDYLTAQYGAAPK